MDSTSKVQKYLADLRIPGGSSTSNNASLTGVRGPGQAGNDPLQFVSTKAAKELSERARQIVTLTDQQKKKRELQMPSTHALTETEAWQEELDTWRRRRRNRTSRDENSPTDEENTHEAKDSKERILTICSPNSVTEENNDSGIENRTNSHSPSTSLDFSPRSTVLSPSLQSPYSVQESGKSSVGLKSFSSHLDQVLIPLNQKAIRPEREESPEYPPPPAHLRDSHEDTVREEFDTDDFVSPTKAHVSATFQAPFEARLQRSVDNLTKEHPRELERNVELVVELNREQKAQVTATKYSKPVQYKPSHNDYSSRKSVDSNHRYTGYQPLSHSISSPNMNTAKMPTTVYHTVDIPFDDTTATYQPVRKDKDGFVSILIEMGGQPAHKGFGFTIVNERRQYVVESVIIGTPADRYGLLIGDRIVSINGEAVDEKYQSEVNRILHEAARMGEIHLQIQRRQMKSLSTSNPNLYVYKKTTNTQKFEETRKAFGNTKGIDSYAEFKRKHTRNARDVPMTRDYNSLPRSSSTSSAERRDGTLSAPQSHFQSQNNKVLGTTRPTQQIYGRLNGTRSSSIRSINDSDYRVSSLHEKSGPGKLTDFVPEVEREIENDKRGYGNKTTGEETRTIRNYELNTDYSSSGTRTYAAPINKSSTLPRKARYEDHPATDDDTQPGKSFLRKNLRQATSLTPPVGILKPEKGFEETSNTYYDSVRSYNKTVHHPYIEETFLERREYHRTGPPRFFSSEDIREHNYDNNTWEENVVDYDESYDEMLRKPIFHTVGTYGMNGESWEEGSPVVERRSEPNRYQRRSKSLDHLQSQEYWSRREQDVSDVTHRFYDRNGRFMEARDGSNERQIPIRVERLYEKRTTMNIPRRPKDPSIDYESDESRDWRDVINQQRQPTPGEKAKDNERIQHVRESMTNLPAIIGRKHEESRKLQREKSDYSYNPKDSYQRQEYTVLERKYDLPIEKYSPPPTATKRYDLPPVEVYDKYAPVPPVPSKRYESPPSEKYVTPPTSVRSSIYERKEREMNEFKSQALREQRESREEKKTTQVEEKTEKYRNRKEEKREEIMKESTDKQQNIVAVSGKHKCSHCGEELGRGAAMIVESLNLYYHLSCFKCYVCKTALGSGATGADVRVRDGHLHCQSCYSNDKVQLSKV